MIKKLAILLFISCFLWAENEVSLNDNDTVDKKDKAEVKKIERNIINEKYEEAQKELEIKKKQELEELKAPDLNMQNIAQVNVLHESISKIEVELKNNILLKRYSNYVSYSKISTELADLKENLKRKTNITDEQSYQLHNKVRVKENELELIDEYKGSPIGGLINPPEIEKYELITNPFGIINALSQIKKLENNKKIFKTLEQDIDYLTVKLDEELLLYLELFNIEPKPEYKDKITFLDKQKKDFIMVLEIVSTTEEVYTRKMAMAATEQKNEIERILYLQILDNAWREHLYSMDTLKTGIGLRGYNQKETKTDTTKHAEMIAIQKSSQKLKAWRLLDCEMYVTLEPCSMCAGAIINSRIKKVYYGTSDNKTGAVGSVLNLFEDFTFNHKVEYEKNIMQTECENILKQFFKELRKNKNV